MNKNYEEDMQYTVKYSRFFLKAIGVWPLIAEHTSTREKIVSIFLIIFFSFCVLFVLIPSSYYCFFYVTDVTVMIELYGPISYCALIGVKYCYLGVKATTYGRCMKHMEKHWISVEDAEQRGILKGNTSVARKITTVCAVLFYSSTGSYYIAMPLWSPVFRRSETDRPLVHPGYEFFVDEQATPTYEFIFIMHCCYCFVTCSVSTANCSLIALFSSHARGLIQVQVARLRDLVEHEGKDIKSQSRLSVIVKNHVEILTFTKNVAQALQEVCFAEVLASVIVTCAAEYLCVLEFKNHNTIATGTYLGLIFSFVFNIFIICYAGQLLVDEGERLGDAYYDIKWYNLPKKKSASLILIIAASKKSPKLTGGKIFEISIPTFSSVLRSSVVYMNLCQAVSA
ncbi:odorant receptor Or2-like [Nomia melanderi]|uniref:odorant receptor Or2-like n=1 Tax=Nomia melanderi TaxID=2448451 RepID=UPI003FCD8C8E